MKYFLIIIFTPAIHFCQNQEVFNEQAFGKGKTAVYFGSGGSSRYLDNNLLKKETIEYIRSPFIVFGIDHCIHPKGSNAYWGIGPYISSWVASKEYVDSQNNKINSLWSSSLLAIKLTHHNSYYVRKKLDMCSAILIGTRMKYYHAKEKNDQDITNIIDKREISPAIGISGTMRYYLYKNLGIYIEIGLGYKTDLAAFGITYKFSK